MAPLLALVAGLLVLAPLSLRPWPRAEAGSAPPAQESYVAPTAEVFGQSSGGISLTAYWLGSGPTVVVVQGALHGGPEANTSALTFQLRDYFASHPDQVPPGVRLAFIPEDPLKMAAVPMLTVLENVAISQTDRYARSSGLKMDWAAIRRDADVFGPESGHA